MRKIILILLITILSQNLNSQTFNVDNSFANNGIYAQNEYSKLWDNSKIIQNEDGSIYFLKQRTDNALNKELNILVRLQSNGIIDTTFGTNGEVIIDIDKADNGLGIRKQTDGKILLCGGVIDTQVVRLLSNGQVDLSFGNNGKTTLIGDGTNSTLGSMNFLLQNGKIIIYTDVNSNVNVSKIFRLNSNGQIDNSFGNNGVVITNAQQILLESTNNITGLKAINNNTYQIEKYNTDGQAIASFGTNGVLTSTSSINFDNIIYAFLDANNNLLFTADSNSNSSSLFKILANGSFDNSFLFNYNTNLFYATCFQHKNGKYYFGGAKMTNSEPNGFLIVKTDEQGNVDNNFGQLLDPNINLKYIESFVINDNNIYVSGTYSDGTTQGKRKIVTKYISSNLTASTNEINNQFTIENPISSQLNYKTKDNIEQILLFSIDGKLVKTIKENHSNVSDLNPGIYITIVKFKNGKNINIKLLKK